MSEKKGYAYLDKYGIMHILDAAVASNRDDAEKRATGAVLEVDAGQYPFDGGIPLGEKGEKLMIYGLNEVFVNSNRSEGTPLDTEKAYPALAALYKRLM